MQVRPGYTGALVNSARYAMACCCATFGASGGSGSSGFRQGGSPWLLVFGGIESTNTTTAVSSLIAAPILSDGTLGNWITLGYTGWGAAAWGHMIPVPDAYVTTALVMGGGIPNTGSSTCGLPVFTLVRNAPASALGIGDFDTPGGWWQALPSSGFPSVAGARFAYDWANNMLLVFRGTNGITSQSGFFFLGFAVDPFRWLTTVAGAWSAGSASGAVRNNATLVYLPAQNPGAAGNNPKSYVYIFGGTSAVAVGDRASALSSVEIGTLTWPSSTVPSATWATSANPLPQAVVAGTAVLGVQGGDTDLNVSRMTVLGGANAGATGLANVESTSVPWPWTGADIAVWQTGVGAGLSAGDLGTGGSIVASSDPTAPAGSQDVTFNYGAVGAAASATPPDGDQVNLSVQFTDKLGGDPSPARSAIVRIGQPPTISNLAVNSSATGQPVISWAFNAGAGGGVQATWRVVVTRNSDSHIMFDSGQRYGQTNLVLVNCAPMLVNAIVYTATVTVTSTDNPVSGSSATGTATLGITPALSGVPATPTGFSAAGDTTNKWVLLGGTAAASTTAIRIYYRETGSSAAYRLYAEVAAASGAFSYKLMDKLSLGQAYDFQVSALGGSAASESAPTSALSATIAADLDSPSGFLHLAGQPLTGALGTAVRGTAWSDMSAESSFKTLRRYNARRALVVQGVADIRHIALEVFSAYSANVATLESLRDQLLAGGVVWWRDRNGVTLPMALEGPTSVKTSYPNHRDFSFVLVQVDDVYSPYLTAGSADGIPTLDYGSIPSLDDAREQVA